MTDAERARIVRRFFRAAGPNVANLAQAMEDVRDTAFYIKDLRQRIVAINRRNREICNIARAEDALGRRSDELFAPQRAEAYMKPDREVIASGKPILNLVRFIPEDRSLSYMTSNIYPVFGTDGKVIGSMRFYRVVDKPKRERDRLDRLQTVAKHITENYMKPLRLADLAKAANLSLTAFKRDFTAVFDMPPGHYILNARINASLKLLKDESRSLSDIALACGFCDQSHFCRIFSRIRGKTPSAYRREQTADRLADIAGSTGHQGDAIVKTTNALLIQRSLQLPCRFNPNNSSAEIRKSKYLDAGTDATRSPS